MVRQRLFRRNPARRLASRMTRLRARSRCRRPAATKLALAAVAVEKELFTATVRKTGSGHGATPDAHGGISPTNGSGGAGNATSGNPPVPGVSVTGGSSVVTLPSFGDGSGSGGSLPPNHSSARKPSQGLDITVVATSTSGGAFEAYRNWLPGGEVYTRYLDTSLGSVVMEFVDPAPSTHARSNGLVGPQPIRVDLPQGLPRARFVVACVLDASGNLKNFRVLEAGPATMDAKVLAALQSWKFQPVMNADQPIEVSAILGFNIDTNDRY